MGHVEGKPMDVYCEAHHCSFEERHIEESEARAVETEAIADTDARTLALPEDVVERLGVRKQREVKVTYADDRQEVRPIVGPITTLR